MFQGQPLHPIKHALQIFTDASKERVGRSLRAHCKRDLATSRKQTAYKLAGTKNSLSSLKRVPVPLLRKHYSSVIHKQGRRYEVGSTVCPRVHCVPHCGESGCTRKQVTLNARHIPGRLNVVADKLSSLGQTIQSEWSLLSEVFNYMQQVVSATDRSVYHEVQ